MLKRYILYIFFLYLPLILEAKSENEKKFENLWDESCEAFHQSESTFKCYQLDDKNLEKLNAAVEPNVKTILLIMEVKKCVHKKTGASYLEAESGRQKRLANHWDTCKEHLILLSAHLKSIHQQLIHCTLKKLSALKQTSDVERITSNLQQIESLFSQLNWETLVNSKAIFDKAQAQVKICEIQASENKAFQLIEPLYDRSNQKIQQALTFNCAAKRLKDVPQVLIEATSAASCYEAAALDCKEALSFILPSMQKNKEILESSLAAISRKAELWKKEVKDLSKRAEEHKLDLKSRMLSLQKENALCEEQGLLRRCVEIHQQLISIYEELLEVNEAYPEELARIKLHTLLYQAVRDTQRLLHPNLNFTAEEFLQKEKESKCAFFSALPGNQMFDSSQFNLSNATTLPWQLNILSLPWLPTIYKPLEKLCHYFFEGLQPSATSAVSLHESPDSPTISLVQMKSKLLEKNNQQLFIARKTEVNPELRSHPVLDQFVSDMQNDPLALMQYVYNEIEWVDPFHIKQNHIYVSPPLQRSAYSTFMDKQGSAWEQCALLVYLLRKAGYQALYAYGDPYSLSAKFLEQMFLTQEEEGEVLVQYPWVLFYDKGKWIPLFPWLKEVQVTEGYDLYSLMPEAYASADLWIERYLCNDENILKHIAPDGNDSAGILFVRFVEEHLRNRGVALEEVGIQKTIRKKQLLNWEDCPRPNQIGDHCTFTQPSGKDAFATISIQISSNQNPKKVLVTEPFLLIDLNCHPLSLSFGTCNEKQILKLKCTDHPKKEYSLELDSSDSTLNIHVLHQIANVDYETDFSIVKGSAAAICFSVGHTNERQVTLSGNAYQECHDQEQKLQTLLAFLGISYFERCSRIEKLLERLHKVDSHMILGYGLAKLSPEASVGWKEETKLVFPQIDMHNRHYTSPTFFSRFHDSDKTQTSSSQCMALIAVNRSSNEHQILRETFQDPHAISTVKLLQIAHQKHQAKGLTGAGFLKFTKGNFSQADNMPEVAKSVYFSNLQECDLRQLKHLGKSQWEIVKKCMEGKALFGLPSFDPESAYVYMTPSLISSENGSILCRPTYTGIGTLIFGSHFQAGLISDGSHVMNGGYGSRLTENWWNQFKDEKFELVPKKNSWTLDFKDAFARDLIKNLDPYGIGFQYFEAENKKNALYEIDLERYLNMKNAEGKKAEKEISWSLKGVLRETGRGFAYLNPGEIFHHEQMRVDVRESLKSFHYTMADPVDVVNGAFYIDEVDLSLPGPFKLELRRNYNSQTPIPSIVGCGWKFGLNPYLVEEGKNIFAAEQDGSVIAYTYNSESMRWEVLAGQNPELNNYNSKGIGSTANPFHAYIVKIESANPLKNQSSYQLYQTDGSIRRFEEGLLQTWTDHAGNTLCFKYKDQRLMRIDSSNGSYIGFYYNHEGKISEAFSKDGRRVHYRYDAIGNLCEVELPNGALISYEYDSLHQIIREKKPHGRVLENWYEQGKVVRQCSPLGPLQTMITSASFTYDEGKTTAVDASGAVTTYYIYQKKIYKIIDPLGNQIHHSWFIDSHTWFDPITERLCAWEGDSGWPCSLKSSKDQRGLNTHYLYDARGNIEEIRQEGADLTGKGDTQLSTFFGYNAQNLCIEKRAASKRTLTFYDPIFTYLAKSIEEYVDETLISIEKLEYNSQGLPLTINYNGAITQWEYDLRGFPIRSIQFTGTEDPDLMISYLFNHQGQCVEKVTPQGIERHDYDIMGNRYFSSMTLHSGNIVCKKYAGYDLNNACIWQQGDDPYDTLFIDYNAAGVPKASRKNLSQIKGSSLEPAGVAYTLYEYNCCGRLIESVNPLGHCTSYAYDLLGRVVNETFEGRTTAFTYEAGGLIASASGPGEALVSRNYTSNGLLKTETDADGAQLSFIYDIFGRIVEESKNGRRLSIQYNDALHQMIRWEGERQEVHTYDPRGNLICMIDPTGSKWIKTYDALNRLKTETSPCGETTIWNYKGDTITCTVASGEKTVQRYEAEIIAETCVFAPNGTLLSKTSCSSSKAQNMTQDWLGGVCITTWKNTLGLPVRIQQGHKVTTHYYDPCGHCVAIVDAEGHCTSQKFDPYGHLIQKTLPDGACIHYGYDAQSHLILCEMPGNLVWRATYDAAGRKTSEWQEAGGERSLEWEYTYENGQLVRVKDPLQRMHLYEYDLYGRLIQESVGKYQRKYIYDLNGKLQTAVEKGQDHSTVKRDYDASGRLVRETIQLNGIVLQNTQQSWTSSTRALQIGEHQRIFHYSGGNLKTLSTPEMDISYEYGLDGSLIRKKTAHAAFDIHYNDDALPQTMEVQHLGNRYQETLTWTQGGKLASYQSTYPETKGAVYHYTPRGYLQADQTEEYAYDHGMPGRGVRTAAPHLEVSEKGLDTFGRVIQENADSVTYQVDHDKCGQVIARGDQQFAWDVWGRLTSVKTNTYEWKACYDALGRRLKTVYTPLKKGYLWNSKGESVESISFYDPEQEFQEIGIACADQLFWMLHGINTVDAIIDSAGKSVTLHHDLRNHLVAIATHEEVVWNKCCPTPFGPRGPPEEKIVGILSFAQTLTWQSRRVDPTGLIWLGARYYLPEAGRFLSPDPISYPACLDLYAYANGDPINNHDLNGRYTSALFDAIPYIGNPYYSLFEGFSYPIVDPRIKENEPDWLQVHSQTFDLKDLGRPELPDGLFIMFGNGILNDYAGARESAVYLSDLAGGYNVHGVYGASYGACRDLRSCLLGLSYQDTGRVRYLHEKWDQLLLHNPNSSILFFPHSRCCIDSRTALLMYPEDLRKRIVVAAIAPGAYIYSESCARVTHYRADSLLRDFIPYFDKQGATREKETIVNITPLRNSKLFAHEFTDPMYVDAIREQIKKYKQEKGK